MRIFTQAKYGVATTFLLIVSIVAFTQGAEAQVEWNCNGRAATIAGTPGDDTIQGTPGVDIIVAREGNDIIYGLGGDDIVCAGKGDDQIYGGTGFDIIFAAQGNDIIYAANGETAADRVDIKGARIFGGAGDDIIHGSSKWDRMQGGPGTDALFGHEGRDWMRAGSGNDKVNGGAGIDDMHGGNGADMIEMTQSDIVRGGSGRDRCNIAVGEPDRVLSCTLTRVARMPTQPMTTTQPVTTTTTTTTPVPKDAKLVLTSCSRRGETVVIKNEGGKSITLNGWILHDAGRNHEAPLNGVTLNPGASVTMLSGLNTTTRAGQTRWSDRNVWNNDGDTAFLLAPNGAVFHQLRCS